MHVIKHIFLFVASGLLLLHSFVPHQHESCSKECAQLQCDLEKNLDSPLAFLMHINLGDNHLEDFNTTPYFYILPPFAEMEKTATVTVELHFTPKESEIHAQIPHRRTLPSRAPPTVS